MFIKLMKFIFCKRQKVIKAIIKEIYVRFKASLKSVYSFRYREKEKLLPLLIQQSIKPASSFLCPVVYIFNI